MRAADIDDDTAIAMATLLGFTYYRTSFVETFPTQWAAYIPPSNSGRWVNTDNTLGLGEWFASQGDVSRAALIALNAADP